MNEKTKLVESLYAFVNQRPGLEFGNYGCVASYRSEQRQIAKDKRHAELLLAFVLRSSISAERIQSGLSAFSGRLSWDGNALSYCAGQYFPTEYRKAVCACLARTVWDWLREECNCDSREKIQAAARRNLGLAVARRWFN